MQKICILLVAFGAGIMLYSIVLFYKSLVILKAQMKFKRLFENWIYAACFTMMLFFLFGYLFNIVFYITGKIVNTQDLLIALIFFFGAIFVLAMVVMMRRMFFSIIEGERLAMEKEIAEQGSKSKSEFLSRMSHEMRTPMNAIIGMTRIGKDSLDLERKNYCFGKVELASTHLLGVINDVLDMSKIEANKLELVYDDFILEKMFASVINIVTFQMEEKQQHFILSADRDIPRAIKSDEQRLSQILTNLLGNAVKFTPNEGTISMFVRKNAQENKSCTLEFEVKDTGIGMSEERQARLFKPFEQTDASISRKYGGTGLGLTISKQIVELMNGKIWTKSEPGLGTSFIFTIDAEMVQPDEHAKKTTDNGDDNEKPENYDFSRLNILIAEDIEINREIVLALLEPTGITIDFAIDGQKVYEMAAANLDSYKIIFMDINMPNMNGFEATEKIRKLDHPLAAKVPIVAMTADVFREDIEKCLAAGMNDHIGKPLDIEIMKQKINMYTKNMDRGL
jgi:signal transduction histidine kinase/CheY-like chemotaxis protein